MFGGGFPGLLVGLEAICFGGFHLFGLLSDWVSVVFRAGGLFQPFVRGYYDGWREL